MDGVQSTVYSRFFKRPTVEMSWRSVTQIQVPLYAQGHTYPSNPQYRAYGDRTMQLQSSSVHTFNRKGNLSLGKHFV